MSIGDPSAISEALKQDKLRVVFDLGSTGFVMALIDITLALHEPSSSILAEAHLLNKQVKFGSDVMSRLKSSQDHGVEALQVTLHQTITACAKALVEALPSQASALTRVFQQKVSYGSGNSAIVSFLHGWPIETLAVSPFQPHKTQSDTSTVAIKPDVALQVESLPLMGGFVGADTVAGVFYIEKHLKPHRPWMMVDIGTNTEIVVCDERKMLWFGSAPAGPAFEGGNITKGMRAEPGAISYAHFDSTKRPPWTIETIGHDAARGICGSGLIDLLAEGVQGGVIHPDGLLPGGSLEVVPGIPLMADDVREFQLAKSATRSACELLITRASTKPEIIFLAGTFAQHLRAESIARVGLLPVGIPFRPIGNASLLGTALWSSVSSQERTTYQEEIVKRQIQVELALQDDFQQIFVQNLNFPAPDA